ncbi:MAG: replicative DNA helicase [Candidatus Kerfeldbacteria bacterium CG08_land_8_20_14_0_20_43_14]|uniref:Replicative DNA helicase n=1 Tax=Candidatus Kerfeldbacteria bacterium CG08_land_8_20_14_0_20_43_14 TaxID=2014246 RepID=A0A2H0YPS0_9BACT|nr:MAG: replicative DNA helicase [Candidatus Kerfeldbacteria bacterium CG08_land_8_20_14_0_20_43_14]
MDKIPPQNLEAEQALLGSLLIDKDAIIKVADILRTEDFYRDIHGWIYEAMRDLYEAHEPIDVVSLSSRLEDKKQLEKIGGMSTLTSLANTVPTASNVINYANIVQKKATLRRLLSAASEISSIGYQEEEDVEKLLDEAEQSIFSVSQRYLRQNFIPIRSVLSEAFDRIDELHKGAGKLRGITSGFPDIDRLLAGFQKSDLIIVAARPSMGKTTLALDFARHAAINSAIPVGLFSLEMSKEQLVDRMLCAEAGVDLWKMRTGRLSDRPEDNDFPKIGHAMGVLSEAPIFIDDSATSNVMMMRTKARRLQAEHGLGMIVVDYLQLMEGRSGIENRVQEVAEITRGLKAIARELNIPVVALSQLSRAVENRERKIPQLADLRESGSIEQDADVVMFIYRPAMYDRDIDPLKKNAAEIHIAKHRNGPTGHVDLIFNENKVRFESKADEEITGQPPA